MKCELPQNINSCPFCENGNCKNKNTCSFKEKAPALPPKPKPYVRKERWYEQYYNK